MATRRRPAGRDPTLFGFELGGVLPAPWPGAGRSPGHAAGLAAGVVVRLWAKDEATRSRWISRIRARTLAPAVLSRLLLLAPGTG